ncbi:histidine kinase dimerization/phosphoacceptor domain -containing protein [uncultured Kordia sp.]|uniref:tetratricopeptide repeat-containing sensor histidine kinase n=1 Tax=uncultured Kordia sp. TaxID=507699 RepID=UPI00260D0416|nr:histidine kinase dimerization/phosphoacceptor domain -containing protein [uncultured Kordia sp.]
MTFNKQLLFSIGFLMLSLSCFAQNAQQTDSLLKVLETQKLPKNEKATLLRIIANDHPNTDEGIRYAKQSLQIAIEINDLVLQGEAWEEIGTIEQRLGNKNNALDATFKALHIYDSLNLKDKQGASYAQIASHHVGEKEYDLAIIYFQKAEKIFSEIGDDFYLAYVLTNLGESYRFAEQLEDATTSLTKALELNKSFKNETIESYSLGNLGMVYAAEGKFAKAKIFLIKAIAITNRLGDVYATSIFVAALGSVYEKEGDFSLSESKYNEAFAMAKSAGLKEQIRDFSAVLTGFYEEQNDYKKALKFQKVYQQYQDSLVNKENIQKNEQLKADYEVSKRESEISLLNITNSNQKKWVFGLITGLLVVLLLTYLLYRGNQKIKKTNTILSDQKELISKREQEKALLLQELNHRVKNNLQMISSLLNLQSRELTGHPAQEAILSGKYRVEALSLVHRKLYQEGVDTKIPLKDYIQELVLGLFEGYNVKFSPSFVIADISIGIDVAIPLALIINEMVINSLKYAYQGVDEPLLKIVMMQETTEYLHIQVIDNGVGFTQDTNEKDNSFGLKLITSLIQQLEGTMEQINTKGTHWEMKIKLS